MTDAGEWRRPESVRELGGDEVHLWRISLEPGARVVPEGAPFLSPDEHARAESFRFDRHRERYVVRRGAMRIILARYLALDPAGLAFRYSPRGKPELEQSLPGHRLRFNLSDSSDLALLGVMLDGGIGVDIEQLRPIPEMDAIARGHFSPRELEEYMRLDPPAKLAAFYNCWTRKEAWLKAIGEGLSRDLDGFDVSLVPGRPPALLSVRDAPGEALRWSLHEIRPRSGFIGAVAVERGPARIVTMSFD